MTTSSTRRTIGAVAGGVLAGVGLTAMMLASARANGAPSEVVAIQRRGLKRLGRAAPGPAAPSAAGEESVAQAWHLALSAAAGAAYAASVRPGTGVLAGGTVFGLGFYVAAHWIAGPLLGVTAPPEWRNPPKAMALHALNHVGFGIATAAGAALAARR